MIIDQLVRASIENLSPRILFHGTRFLVPILIHDELATSNDEHVVNLTSDLGEAAQWAARGPRPFDEGRGAIVALDWSGLEIAGFNLSQCEGQDDLESDYYTSEPIHPLSDFILGIFWLDQIIPGLGLHERTCTPGTLTYPAHAYAGAQTRIWQIRDRMKARGVVGVAVAPFENFYEAAIYGDWHVGPSELPPHAADQVHASSLPGVRIAGVWREIGELDRTTTLQGFRALEALRHPETLL